MRLFDSQDPNFERKASNITSLEELRGFEQQLDRERRENGRAVTRDELTLLQRKKDELSGRSR